MKISKGRTVRVAVKHLAAKPDLWKQTEDIDSFFFFRRNPFSPFPPPFLRSAAATSQNVNASYNNTSKKLWSYDLL